MSKFSVQECSKAANPVEKEYELRLENKFGVMMVSLYDKATGQPTVSGQVIHFIVRDGKLSLQRCISVTTEACNRDAGNRIQLHE